MHFCFNFFCYDVFFGNQHLCLHVSKIPGQFSALYSQDCRIQCQLSYNSLIMPTCKVGDLKVSVRPLDKAGEQYIKVIDPDLEWPF